MGSMTADIKKPWIETPCIYSAPLSKAAGCNIWLKLENLQPSGSFKSRGVGNLMIRAAAAAPPGEKVHFYCSSGGNAGLACITAAIALKQPATIVVPLTTSPLMISKLKVLGADVHQTGENWAAADRHLREELLAKDPSGVYVPPFDHPDVWDGAATLVNELATQMDTAVDGIVCSVGGGGLMNGIMLGVERNSWPMGRKPKVLAVETQGADSLNLCVRTRRHVALPGITSIATSLGAPKVSEQSYKWLQSPDLTSIVVDDAEAAASCVRFADDARFLVEAACGATIATAYYDAGLRKTFQKPGVEWDDHNIVLVVCGGSGVTVDILEKYRKEYMLVSK